MPESRAPLSTVLSTRESRKPPRTGCMWPSTCRPRQPERNLLRIMRRRGVPRETRGSPLAACSRTCRRCRRKNYDQTVRGLPSLLKGWLASYPAFLLRHAVPRLLEHLENQRRPGSLQSRGATQAGNRSASCLRGLPMRLPGLRRWGRPPGCRLPPRVATLQESGRPLEGIRLVNNVIRRVLSAPGDR
jgi:hypothetical protein